MIIDVERLIRNLKNRSRLRFKMSLRIHIKLLKSKQQTVICLLRYQLCKIINKKIYDNFYLYTSVDINANLMHACINDQNILNL